MAGLADFFASIFGAPRVPQPMDSFGPGGLEIVPNLAMGGYGPDMNTQPLPIPGMAQGGFGPAVPSPGDAFAHAFRNSMAMDPITGRPLPLPQVPQGPGFFETVGAALPTAPPLSGGESNPWLQAVGDRSAAAAIGNPDSLTPLGPAQPNAPVPMPNQPSMTLPTMPGGSAAEALIGNGAPNIPGILSSLFSTWKTNVEGSGVKAEGGPFRADQPTAPGATPQAGTGVAAQKAPPARLSWPDADAPKSKGASTVTIGADGTVTQGGGTSSQSTPAQGQPANRAAAIDNYLPKMVGQESGGKMIPNQAGASSAFGPAQFTDGTWIATMRKHEPASINGLSRAEILELRKDPKIHMDMARKFTEDNAAILESKGLPVNDATLYAMHFFGEGAGPKVLQADRNAPLANHVPASTISANPHLRGMTVGQAQDWAANSMAKQGGGGGGGRPGMPNLQAPQLPEAPTLQAPAGVDLSAWMKIIEGMKPEPRERISQSEKANMLWAAMASGGASAKDLGAFFSGAGGGAARAAAYAQGEDRELTQKEKDDRLKYKGVQADAALQVAKTSADNTNLGIATANQNQEAAYRRALEQSKLDAGVANEMEKIKTEIDWKLWDKGQPQVTATKDGITVVKKNPDGSINLTTQRFNDIDADYERQKDMISVLGRENPAVVLEQYKTTAKRLGDWGVKRQLVTDMVDGDQVPIIFGQSKQVMTQIDNAVKAALKNVPPEAQADDKAMTSLRKNITRDVVFGMIQQGAIPDDTWISAMARAGHPAAAYMVSGAQQ